MISCSEKVLQLSDIIPFELIVGNHWGGHFPGERTVPGWRLKPVPGWRIRRWWRPPPLPTSRATRWPRSASWRGRTAPEGRPRSDAGFELWKLCESDAEDVRRPLGEPVDAEERDLAEYGDVPTSADSLSFFPSFTLLWEMRTRLFRFFSWAVWTPKMRRLITLFTQPFTVLLYPSAAAANIYTFTSQTPAVIAGHSLSSGTA